MKNPLEAAHALPKGAAILLRHTDSGARAHLAHTLKPIVRRRGLYLIIAGDAALAARINADGLHLPEVRAREARHLRALHPSWLITAAAHSARAIGVATQAGADAVLLAPVFATRSHKERAPLGAPRSRLIAAEAKIAVYVLGGIHAKNAARLKGARLAGIAAIDGLLPDHNA